MINIGWQLNRSNAQGNIFDNGYSEIFKSGKWAILAREIIQNSLDAIRENEKTLKMKISLEEINTSEINPEYVIQHIKGTLSISGLPLICEEFSKSAIKKLNQEKIKVLKISDYNTTGIVGSEKLNDCKSNWNALIYDEGNSQKSSETSAGSKGLGKNAPMALSGLNMLFYVTRDINQKYAVEGVAKLHTSYINGIKYENKIYYAKSDNGNLKPLDYYDCLKLPKIFHREETGSDVIIIGIDYDTEKLKKEMIQSTVENFFVLIENNQLEINILGEEITKNNIWKIIDKYCDKPIEYTSTNIRYGLVKQYLNTYTKKYTVTDIIEDVAGAGKLRLLISKEPEISGKWIAMFRNNGMKIFDLNIRTAEQNFSAIFFPGDADVDKFLKSIENAVHDSFDPEIRINDKEQRKLAIERYDKIKKWIRLKVENYTKIEIKEQDFLDGMEEYLQLEDSETESNVIQNPDVDIIEYKPKSKEIETMIEGKTIAGENEQSDFSQDDGESEDKNQFVGTSTHEPGTERQGLIKDYHNKFKVLPKIISKNNQTKVAFTLDNYTEPYFNIEINTVGDDNKNTDYIPNIISAYDLNTGRNLKVFKNNIIDIPNSQTNIVLINFERNFIAKYNINIYKKRGV